MNGIISDFPFDIYVKELCAVIALCGYPLVKVPVEKICSFAPILLRFDYFRQNIWRLFFAQFHFWCIFGD